MTLDALSSSVSCATYRLLECTVSLLIFCQQTLEPLTCGSRVRCWILQPYMYMKPAHETSYLVEMRCYIKSQRTIVCNLQGNLDWACPKSTHACPRQLSILDEAANSLISSLFQDHQTNEALIYLWLSRLNATLFHWMGILILSNALSLYNKTAWRV